MWSMRTRYLETGEFLVCADYAMSGEMTVMNDWLTGKNVEEIRRGILLDGLIISFFLEMTELLQHFVIFCGMRTKIWQWGLSSNKDWWSHNIHFVFEDYAMQVDTVLFFPAFLLYFPSCNPKSS